MKNNKASINKMIKGFDKELRNLLLTDLKVMKVAHQAFSKTKMIKEQLMIA